MMAAFHRKLREGVIDRDEYHALLDQYMSEVESGALVWLPIGLAVMDLVHSVVRAAPFDHFLRAADAIHLACASVHGFGVVHANDRHLLAAAPLFGVRGSNVIAA